MHNHTLFTCHDGNVSNFCCQNEIKMRESLQNEKLLHAIDFVIIYKKWALQHEKTCIATCDSYGFNKVTMIKCVGCQNSYHYTCLHKLTGITMEYLKKHDMQLMCNIGQPCLYLNKSTIYKNMVKKTWKKNLR